MAMIVCYINLFITKTVITIYTCEIVGNSGCQNYSYFYLGEHYNWSVAFIPFTIFLVIVTKEQIPELVEVMSYVISELELRFIAASLISFISSNNAIIQSLVLGSMIIQLMYKIEED